ncbi:hypothetical protein F5888DRAFT_1633519 [Russula emetica]|nr:hypothetical protein F5888DRAFT_1633519 [Russula emetica]
MEILKYARKAVEVETSTQAACDRQKIAEDKLLKLSEQLDKAAERLESVATEIHAKLSAVSSMTSQLESTANTYKAALMKGWPRRDGPSDREKHGQKVEASPNRLPGQPDDLPQ